MRICEILLVVVNVLSLVLIFRRLSKGAWLGIAGVNLAVCVMHGLLEDLRYQMVFAYMFVVMFLMVALVKMNDRVFKGRVPRVLKVSVVVLAVICLMFSCFLAYALPVFSLPEPTGRNSVGVTYFHLVDEKRNEPFLANSTQKRELMVKVYYPAQRDDSKPFVTYFHNSPELIKLFTAGYGLPDFAFDHLNLIKTHARDHLQVADGQQSYPVVLFSHGGGTSMEVHTVQCEDLASHGYIVVAIDHTYVSGATVFPDKTVTARDATTDFKVGDPAVVIAQIMADDAKFVIDKLNDMNKGTFDPQFKGRLKLDSIGIIGQSLGGSAAYNLAINDSRIKAAINLDGSVYVTPKEGNTTGAPFLMLANDRYHMQAIQRRESLLKKFEDMSEEEKQQTLFSFGSKEAYNDAYQASYQSMVGLANALKASGNAYTIVGSDHMKFADIGLYIGESHVREMIGIGGETEPVRCLEVTEALTLAFFEHHLQDGSQEALVSVQQKYPELRHIDVK